MRMGTLPYGIVVAAVSGLLGSSFFMLIQLQQRLTDGGLADARDMWTWPLLMLRCTVGVGAALILYFFFKSGLLAGSLWPNLSQLAFTAVKPVAAADGSIDIQRGDYMVPNRDFALLVVWSFLAGYSQTLVPNLLLSTESKSQTSAK